MTTSPYRNVPRAYRLFGAILFVSFAAALASAAEPNPGTPLTIHRATGAIVCDGNLDDAGWQGVAGVTSWFETRVGDNVEPQVKNLAYLAYDDKYLYAGFRFDDPAPGSIRAPLGDHDQLSGSTDYGGVIVDSRNDGKTAQMFLANPRGLQYDALSSDVSGEDNAPDYFWDAAGKITETGWNLEIRVPFSSLRYGNEADPTWGILLYRNYPRDRHYQFFSARLPRDVNCFICNSSKLTGLSKLPRGSHLVVAPYVSGAQNSQPIGDLGSPLARTRYNAGSDPYTKKEAGGDLKWSPIASAAIDATWNPDFSQVEADVAQISANERFALSFPEKRPFFLEGADLFSTPMQAVYTRTITAPSGGVRATGRAGSTGYTALYTRDKGGGSAILPGPQGSRFVDQDFSSDVGVLRVRRDLGRSFVSVLGTTRELGGGRYNRVGGPDFQWRSKNTETITGQILWSESNTPVRPDLDPSGEWNGQRLRDHAAQAAWAHNTPKVDVYLQGQDFGDDFRADDGFMPQVGYREVYFETGYTIRPKDKLFSRIRLFTANYVDAEPDGDILNRHFSVGTGMDGRWSSFLRIELNRDELRSGSELFQRFRPRVVLEASPGRVLNYFSVDTQFGGDIDFANGREGRGVNLTGSCIVRPSSHLELNGRVQRRWLSIDAGGSDGWERLFLAEVERLRATWMFNSKAFVRLIGQYAETTRDASLYGFPVGSKAADFTGSALFAYKLNWQTVLYAGYGDAREYDAAADRLQKAGQQAFAKVSYAWQQ